MSIKSLTAKGLTKDNNDNDDNSEDDNLASQIRSVICPDCVHTTDGSSP